MKALIFGVFCCFPLWCNAQDYETAKYEKEVCNCFDRNTQPVSAQNYERILMDCLSGPLEGTEKEIFALFGVSRKDIPEGMSDLEFGMELGKKVIRTIQPKLISSCDSYYEFMSATQDLMFAQMKVAFTKTYSDSISAILKDDPSRIDLNFERGIYNLGQSNFEQALEDFEICQDNFRFNLPGLYFTAWTHEIQEDYSKAIDYYNAFLVNAEPKLSVSNSSINALVSNAKIRIAIIEREQN